MLLLICSIWQVFHLESLQAVWYCCTLGLLSSTEFAHHSSVFSLQHAGKVAKTASLKGAVSAETSKLAMCRHYQSLKACQGELNYILSSRVDLDAGFQGVA